MLTNCGVFYDDNIPLIHTKCDFKTWPVECNCKPQYQKYKQHNLYNICSEIKLSVRKRDRPRCVGF